MVWLFSSAIGIEEAAVSYFSLTLKGMQETFRIHITGAVQGIGFRPFVYRIAKSLDLSGWVLNSPQGVFIEAEGEHNKLVQFIHRLKEEKPTLAFIHSLEFSVHDAIGYADFEIRKSEIDGEKTAFILPDIATCKDCLQELFDPDNRRYHYPFINCTHCGPRFSIINALPYDRPHTSMKDFVMCTACQHEYDDPGNRRFHAQPNACPECGPQLEFWNDQGEILAEKGNALKAAADLLRQGKIIALKGIGGFQLLADASSEQAVQLCTKESIDMKSHLR
jgi:hydrogenase maturation protein HypF